MPELRRIGVLLLTQATRPTQVEDAMLRDDVVGYQPAPSSTPHQNSTNIADLDCGLRCFHKPISGVEARLARIYGHEPIAAGLNECAAWRLARFMGPPYDALVPTTVLRFHEAGTGLGGLYVAADGWGSLADEQPGTSLDPSPFAIPRLNDSAAFFDALIAQQDRHAAQYRWDGRARRLGLIDHGFAFARGKDLLNASVFLAQRHADGRAALSEDEQAALQRIEESNFVGLGDVLDPDQANALTNRVRQMRATGRLVKPGEWCG